MKIKVFKQMQLSTSELENQVNDFISDVDVQVIDIKLSEYEYHLTILVIYEGGD